MRTKVYGLLILAGLLNAANLVGAQGSRDIGYPSVAAALEALKARKDVKISVQGGWTIADDPANRALWSFTPMGHPAYPAAVRRALVEVKGNVVIETKALCEASKAACDRLVEDFKELNNKAAQDARASREATAAAKPAPASEISVQRIADDTFSLTLKSYRSATVQAGQEELLPKAAELCGERKFDFTKYQFEAMEALDPGAAKGALLLKQEIHCGGNGLPAVSAVSTGNQDRQWRPSSAQELAVELQTQAYFSNKDGKKYSEAYAMLSAPQREAIPFDRWKEMAQQFNGKAGKVINRWIRKVTWYKDPARGGPGTFVAVDFAGQFENIDLHCGYVVWKEQGDGAFLLMREEENFVDKETLKKISPADLEKVRAQFKC